MTDTPLPYNLQTEASLLGALVLDNQLIHNTKTLLAEHFFDKTHGEIFSGIREAAGEGRPANTIEIARKVGQEAISAVLMYPCLPMEASDYAEGIVEDFRKRRVIQSCQLAIDLVRQGKNFTEASSVLNAEMEVLMSEGVSVVNDATVTEQILERLKNKTTATSTGLSSLDAAMDGGLYAKKSYGFCARKKVGKTALAATISYNLGQRGVRHLFICGEMGAHEIHERMLSRHADCWPSAFRTDFKDNTNFQLKVADYVRTSKKAILYQDAPGLTFDELKQYVTAAVYKDKIEGVILDYWQLVGGKKKNQSTAEHLDDVAQWLANYCRRVGIWNITMAQLNQEGNTRGSEGIKLAFDHVYTLHRDDLSSDEAWLEMTDNRYTKWANIGSKEQPGLYMMEKGPYFSEPLQAVKGVKS